MSVNTNHAAVGQHIPMVSPPFDAQVDHCLVFDYKVWASPHTLVNTPAPRLEVYLSDSSHVYFGWKLWTSKGTTEGHAQISIWAKPASVQRVSFVGIIGDPESTSIRVANIQLNEANCKAVDCVHHSCEASGTITYLPVDCKFDILLEAILNIKTHTHLSCND